MKKLLKELSCFFKDYIMLVTVQIYYATKESLQHCKALKQGANSAKFRLR